MAGIPWHKKYSRSPEDLLKTVSKDFKNFAEFKQRFESVFGKDAAPFERDGVSGTCTPSNVFKGANGMGEEDLRALYEETFVLGIVGENLETNVKPYAEKALKKQESIVRFYEKTYENLLAQKKYSEAQPWGQKARELREQFKSTKKIAGELIGREGAKARQTNIQRYITNIENFRQQLDKFEVKPPAPPIKPIKIPKRPRVRITPFPWRTEPVKLSWIFNNRKVKSNVQLRENFFFVFGLNLSRGAIASHKYKMRKLTKRKFDKIYKKALKQE
jgi:hypothetical protein